MGTLAACKKKEGSAHRIEGAPAEPAPASAEPLGPVRGETATVRVAVYFLPTPKTPPRAELDRLLAAEQGLTVVSDAKAMSPLPLVHYTEPPINEFAPPDASQLQYLAKGLSDAEVAAVPASTSVAVMRFSARTGDAMTQLRRAHALATSLAASTGGLVWSEDARLVFGADAWQTRGHALDDDPPDVQPLFVVHAYRADTNAGIRLVSLGLGQLGLPDLVIEDAAQAEGERCMIAINLAAQLLAEGAQPDANGLLVLDVGQVKNAAAKKRLQAAVSEKGTGKGTVRLVVGERDDGDAENRLWRIDFPGDGAYHERLATTVGGIFGRHDEALGGRTDDAELLAASRKAKADLPALRARFAKGLAERDHLLMKAPFKTDDGDHEFMWIEVRTWQGGRVQGVLTDEPFQVSTLHAGASVEVEEKDVFDYILFHADGTEEGNYTTPILEKRGETWPGSE
jgi:uncharacterized protein YegJ (DUF2314 family)